MKCPFCGTDNAAGEAFCINCGGYLASAPAPSAGSSSSSAAPPNPPSNPGITSGTLTPNSRLQQGRYLVEKILGQGGMGTAVIARDSRVSNKTVVIKELLSESTDPIQRQEDVRNFEREVETLATLDHPLIPSVTDSFEEGGRYYMVQEYAQGENLENRMERENKPMSEQEALQYISQVLDILDYLSEQKPPIVHRDMKPANIIISSKNKRAHLVDFGIARADVAKKHTTALGTPGYAPPEQYQGKADARSDLYALAATLHHLLTNRDPRNYPPFNYPAPHTLNVRVNPETEQMLERALTMDASKRYQSAAEMKSDVDGILARRFMTAPDTSIYMTGTGTRPTSQPIAPTQAGTGPTVIAGGTAAQRAPYGTPRTTSGIGGTAQPAQYRNIQPVQQQMQQQQMQQPRTRQTAPPMIQPVSPPKPPKKQGGNGYVIPSFILLIVVVGLIGGALFVLPRLGGTQSGTTTGATPTITGTLPPAPTITQTGKLEGIGVSPDAKGQPIGISEGSFVFDTDRPGGALKKQGAEALKNGDISTATTSWRGALQTDTNDAETHIYLENQRVLDSGNPYITIVVGTMLTGANAGVGRDILQGSYIAQKEFNANNGALLGGVQVRLLVANSGDDAANASRVAQQVVEAAKSDKTIAGVVGWSFSAQTENAIRVLSQARIPMVSPTASSDALTSISQFFFRVAPSNTQQAIVGANYAYDKIGARQVALFGDPQNSYSASLAQGFKDAFRTKGGSGFDIVYKIGDPQSIKAGLEEALQHNPKPDLIYFSGYATDVDEILKELPNKTDFPDLKVMGGDALYDLSGYPDEAKAGFNRLRFTAFSYPDEWGVLGLDSQKPVFYNDYATTYDPKNEHQANPYGYQRAAFNAVLSYDALLAMLTASGNALEPKSDKTLTPQELQQALKNIKGPEAVQGVSGQIAFGDDGNPINKAIVILFVDPNGFIKMESQLGAGEFLKK